MTDKPNPLNPNGPDPSEETWQLIWNVKNKRWYYLDTTSREVFWEQPKGCTIPLPKDPPAGADDTTPLPAGWETYYDPTHKRLAFHNPTTGARQWDRPKGTATSNGTTTEAPKKEEPVVSTGEDDLPEGWKKHTDPSSKRDYYVGPDGKTTTWDRPTKGTTPATNGTTQKASSDWEVRWDHARKTWCYIDAKTKAHSYKRPENFTLNLPAAPPELPAGWTAAYCNTRNQFYYLSPDNKSQWEAPALPKKQEETKAQEEKPKSKETQPQGQDHLASKGPTEGVKVEESKSQNTQGKDSSTKESSTQAKKPQGALPPGWEKQWNDEHKRFYYFNRTAKLTQWDPPKEVETQQQDNNQSSVGEKKANDVNSPDNSLPKQADTKSSQQGSVETNRAIDKKLENVTVGAQKNATANETKPTSAQKATKKLRRGELDRLAKLVLAEVPKDQEMDVDDLLQKFWKTHAREETTLEDFFRFIGLPQQ